MAEQGTKKSPSNPPFPNPFEMMRDAMGQVMHMFLEPLSRSAPVQIQWRPAGFRPSIDIIEEDDHIRVVVEAPGMMPEDLSVSVSEDSLTVRGQKKREEEEGRDIHRRERLHGPFRRVIPLPVKVDRDNVEATFKNGVLNIVLPKSPETTKRIPIKTETGK